MAVMAFVGTSEPVNTMGEAPAKIGSLAASVTVPPAVSMAPAALVDALHSFIAVAVGLAGTKATLAPVMVMGTGAAHVIEPMDSEIDTGNGTVEDTSTLFKTSETGLSI